MLNKDVPFENCLPFIIGVTGHRDLDQPERYKDDIRKALTFWLDEVDPSTPIWFLSGLAIGADLLATEVALELQETVKDKKLKIIGCLPMPLENYAMDFEGLQYAPAAREKLYNVIAQLKKDENELIEVRHSLSHETYHSAIHDKSYSSARNSLYLNQGLFIAKYSNVLISLWDGKEAKGIGGTADIVRYKLGDKVSWPVGTENPALQSTSDFDGQTPGLVHHLLASRHNSGESLTINCKTEFTQHITNISIPIGELYSSIGKSEKADSFLQSFLSREFKKLTSDLTLFNRQARDLEIGQEHDNDVGLEETASIFKAADALALLTQTTYRNFVLVFFLLAIPGYCLYEISSNWVNTGVGLGIFSIIFMVILSCWWVIKKTTNQDIKWKYQLARGVAEAMRVRGFLNIANVEPSATTLIPRRFRLHFPLLNHAVSVAEFDWWRHPSEFNKQYIEQKWLHDQLNFLNSRLQQSANSFSELLYKRPSYAANLASKFSRGFFYGAIFTGVALMVLMSIQYMFKVTLFLHLNTWLMLLLQYNLMISGLIMLWSELAGYEVTAKGYESLEELYKRAQILLTDELTPSKKQMLLDLAHEAMVEHVMWTTAEMKNDLKNKQ
ncbi:DUF1273 domain-containing protein [Pseudoalteromonas sp. SCSIO 43101]|uniref:DUF1273 domain-containing protein n=1 Tax=Pseudoalteromonas sp. SCSIO 43101 TaxID=2822847 RepID=UPI00202B4737|nr:DUF1273 domain-containing protein [Pseudoalteromonas sp. SCSIO 43101]URQ90089.1 hypothetical protein J8Z25_15215 [Pseudoalteromonas sp. SCSIO 43101]